MQTKTQSYDVFDSAQFKSCKALNEVIEEIEDDDSKVYRLGQEFEGIAEECVVVDHEKAGAKEEDNPEIVEALDKADDGIAF